MLSPTWVRARRQPSAEAPAALVGFTLLELLVVITVIAILAGIVSPMIFGNVGEARVTAARAEMETIGLALEAYALHNDGYPSTAQGLAALIRPPTEAQPARNWRGPYLKGSVPRDPWGNLYLYRSPGVANPESYDLLSYGRDGRAGGDGADRDLVSWEESQR